MATKLFSRRIPGRISENSNKLLAATRKTAYKRDFPSFEAPERTRTVMRSTIITYFAVAALFSGCAYEGVIVEKRFRPAPFYDSMGIDGIYKFQLRDASGQIHSQMVTPDVFASYEVGDYFNDLQAPPARGSKDFKSVPAPPPPEMNQVPYQPVKTTRVNHRAKGAGKTAQTQRHTQRSTKTAKATDRAARTTKTAKTQQPTKNITKAASAKHSAKKHKTAKAKHRATRTNKTAKAQGRTRRDAKATSAHHRSRRAAKTTKTAKVQPAAKRASKSAQTKSYAKRSSKTAKAKSKAKHRKITRKHRPPDHRASA